MSLPTSAQDSNRRQLKSLMDSGFAYRSSSSLKIIKEWKTVNHTSGLKLLFYLIPTVISRNKQFTLNFLKNIGPLYESEDTPFDIIIIRKYSKLSRIIRDKQLLTLKMAIDKIREYLYLPIFYKNLPGLRNRISLNVLSTQYKTKLFKHNFLKRIKQKSLYSTMKVRFLMGVCENFLSKKNIDKLLYDGFRQWYLRTTVKTLYILDREMIPLMRQRVNIGARTLKIVKDNRMKSYFEHLRLNQFYKYNEKRNQIRKREILKFMEVMYTVFARFMNKNEIFHLPCGGDSTQLYLYSQGFEGIKFCLRYNKNKKLLKGIDKIINFFRLKKLELYDSFFRLPMNNSRQQCIMQFEENKIASTDLLFWHLHKKLSILNLSFFDRLKLESEFKVRKVREKNLIVKVMTRTVDSIQAQQLLVFKNWKEFCIKRKDKQLATHLIFDSLKNLYLKEVFSAFVSIKSHLSFPKIISSSISKIFSHSCEYSALAAEITKTKQIFAFQKLLMKPFFLENTEEKKLKKYFHKWQDQISFCDSKLNEYNQLLNILENEINYLDQEIGQNVETHREYRQELQNPMSFSATKINLKMKYLEFLEIQNSELIEVLESIEVPRDAETRAIEYELMERPKRSYSI